MNDFQSINDIVNEGIRNSSYISVIISSCVFLLYILITKLFDFFKSKNNNKPIIEMGNAIKEVTANVVKLNNVLDKVFQDNEKKEMIKCKNTIELAGINFENRIEHYCRDIIIHNNINDNKELIMSNIRQLVNTEYYKAYSILSIYEFNNSSVSDHMKETWIAETSQKLIDIIYNGKDNENRISSIIGVMTVMTNSYVTYVYNKTFNN